MVEESMKHQRIFRHHGTMTDDTGTSAPSAEEMDNGCVPIMMIHTKRILTPCLKIMKEKCTHLQGTMPTKVPTGPLADRIAWLMPMADTPIDRANQEDIGRSVRMVLHHATGVLLPTSRIEFTVAAGHQTDILTVIHD